MIIRTKKYKMPSGLYIKLGMQNILRLHWWIFLLLLLGISATFFIKTIWFIVGSMLFFIGYLLFWLIQFYGFTQLEENRLIFERVIYEINNQYLIMQVNSRQAIPFPWINITKAYKKKAYFLLILSKAQFFCLPFKIFRGDNEVKLFTTLLQRKGLLKG
ncbi:hypothetical protein DK880_00525 [Candidatus Cardinium hertigii]|uniref:YcxB-like C-terminal domain-containing protein n=2 Tax=Candidatus Cardinium hertigii TaxID=247481 RepID=A0A2Z3LH58_9BACT|nr:hypothetical protein DK880_00525 [Candidatus Cardinium hertigii]